MPFVDQYEFPLHRLNSGSVHLQGVLPLPPAEGMPAKINTYDDVPEPRFDPAVHLDLQRPKFVTLFPDCEKADAAPRVDSNRGSRFAYSAPFQVLSEEGVRVAKEIAFRNMGSTVGPEAIRGAKIALRGGYYLSPWLRDLQNCEELHEFFQEFVGEKLVPHCLYSNVPQINFSIPGVANAPVDTWHYDSVAYTGVVLLNNMDDLRGGELELMKMDKNKGLKALSEGKIVSGVHTEVISYEKPGKMILAQGSEVLHHVTPVLTDQQRISMIIAYTPANCYQPTKSILNTMRIGDAVHHLADYEFFREKAWQCSAALKGYCYNIPYTSEGKKLAPYLRAVAEELTRVSDLLDSVTDDPIDMFDEVNNSLTSDMTKFNKDVLKETAYDVGTRSKSASVIVKG